jgi:hypothetical protein
MSPRPRASLAAAALVAGLLVAACGGTASPSPDPSGPPASPAPTPIASPTPPSDGAVVVTFRAANGKLWRQRLVDPADIAIAREIASGARGQMIPNGKIVRSGPDVNEGWSWHLDPADFEWAEVAIEVCDGLPDHVEDGSLTSDRYCSWSAEVVAVEPLP